jgi:hypothetical protein
MKQVLQEMKKGTMHIEEFVNSVHLANDLIPFQSLVETTRATFTIIESLESGLPIEL